MHVVLCTGLALLALPGVQAADGECGVCGTEITQSSNVFTISKPNGTSQAYGCPGCGLNVLSHLTDQADVKLEAQDFLSRQPIDGRKAWYVTGSSVSFCCEPSWLAFSQQDQATAFVKGFGGEVLDFEAALKRASGEDHSHMLESHEHHH